MPPAGQNDWLQTLTTTPIYNAPYYNAAPLYGVPVRTEVRQNGDTVQYLFSSNLNTTAATTNYLTYQINVSTLAFTQSIGNLDLALRQFGEQTLRVQQAQQIFNVATGFNNTTAYFTPTPDPEAQKKRELRKKRAAARARKLLREHLTQQEVDQLAAAGYFEVTSLSSGRRYRIYQGHSRNIIELDKAGRAVARLCAYPSGGLPDEDHMLAQRLYLQIAEDEFRKVANIWKIGTVEADEIAARLVLPPRYQQQRAA